VTEHPNATLVRGLFQAFRDADVARIQSALAASAVWHFPGRRGQLAGTHRGREAIFAFLVNVQALTGQTFHLDLLDVLANDHHAVALFTGHATRNGKTLENPTCLRMRIDNSQIVEVWEFVWDLYQVDDFWA
jgi:ketosteroid isomerase-like protein